MVQLAQLDQAIQFLLMDPAVQRIRLDQMVHLGRWVPKDQEIQVVRMDLMGLEILVIRHFQLLQFHPVDLATLHCLEVLMVRLVLWVLFVQAGQAVQRAPVSQEDQCFQECLDCQVDLIVQVARVLQAAH